MNFGTKVGRLLTSYVTLPFAAAFLIIETGNLISNFLVRSVRFFGRPVTFDQSEAEVIASTVGLMSSPLGHGPVLAAPPAVNTVTPGMLRRLGTLEFGSPVYIALFVMFGFFMMGLLHSARLRQKVWQGTVAALQLLKLYLIQGPILLLRSTALKNAVRTWSFQLFYWFVFKPLVLFVLLWLFISVMMGLYRRPISPDLPWWGWAIVFLVSNFLVNSRPGQAMTNALSYSTVQFLEQIRAGLLPRLFNFVVGIFKNSVHFVEAMLFYVDEKLRLRKGDSEGGMVVRAVLTVFWFPISYLARFNLVVFIEPFLNPLKLPVCTIAYKFYLPAYFFIQSNYLSVFWNEGHYFTWAVSSWVNFWFADVFGFVFWEVKENWRLYRANRGPYLKPVAVGPHGESLAGLLEPGFHSGTVPKLYAHLRHAERQAYETGNWSGVRTCQAELSKVAESVRLFLVRDFVALLDQDPAWRNQSSLDHLVRVGLSPYAPGQGGMNVGKVNLATNQIFVELIHPRFEEEPVQLEFASRCGWLIAGFGNVGWLRQLSDKQVRPLHNALIMLYKLAGVDLVREQLRAVLPPEAAHADLSPLGIYVPPGKPAHGPGHLRPDHACRHGGAAPGGRPGSRGLAHLDASPGAVPKRAHHLEGLHPLLATGNQRQRSAAHRTASSRHRADAARRALALALAIALALGGGREGKLASAGGQRQRQRRRSSERRCHLPSLWPVEGRLHLRSPGRGRETRRATGVS